MSEITALLWIFLPSTVAGTRWNHSLFFFFFRPPHPLTYEFLCGPSYQNSLQPVCGKKIPTNIRCYVLLVLHIFKYCFWLKCVVPAALRQWPDPVFSSFDHLLCFCTGRSSDPKRFLVVLPILGFSHPQHRDRKFFKCVAIIVLEQRINGQDFRGQQSKPVICWKEIQSWYKNSYTSLGRILRVQIPAKAGCPSHYIEISNIVVHISPNANPTPAKLLLNVCKNY